MAGLDVLMEPINTRDIPRFYLNRQDHAHEIIGLVGAPNLKVQLAGLDGLRIPTQTGGSARRHVSRAGLVKDPALKMSLPSYNRASDNSVTMVD